MAPRMCRALLTPPGGETTLAATTLSPTGMTITSHTDAPSRNEGSSAIAAADRLHDPMLNKGTAFSEEERDQLGLRGLLPPRVFTQAQQVERCLASLRQLRSPLDQYLWLSALHDRNERLFYRLLTANIAEFLPIVYTPTVGEACREFGRIFQRPRGLYISLNDRGRVKTLLHNWPYRNVRVIVVTDGERILGLGDLGAHGMGIPIGKLSLYTACAGIDPSECLPLVLDVGTNNKALLHDPFYIGLAQPRRRDSVSDELIEEFVTAANELFPGVLIQFEDFATDNAVRLLQRYRERACMFNDDIQGTAAVTLAGLVTASHIARRPLSEQTILFVGAGAAAVGIADLCTHALMREGMSEIAARERIWLFDSQGIVTTDRDNMADYKKPYARTHQPLRDLESAIATIRPSALIGASGKQGIFTGAVLSAMASINDRPIVFALSNPTANSECTAEEAYEFTGGRALFASGSPFGPVKQGERTFVPSQANNVYVFPGVGLGVLASGASRVTDEMFLAAAAALAKFTEESVSTAGSLFPPLERMPEVSLAVGVAVADVAHAQGLATGPRPDDLREHLVSLQFDPRY